MPRSFFVGTLFGVRHLANSANSAGSTLCLALDTFPNSFVDTLFVELGSVPDFFDNKKVPWVPYETVFPIGYLVNSADSVGSTLSLALDTFPNSFVNTLFVGLGFVSDFFDNSLA